MEYTIYTVDGKEFELKHYGVKGMKWGKRKNVYDINAAYYNKRAAKLERRANTNRVMGSMQRAASKSSSGLLSKATAINANYYEKRAAKLTAKANKNRFVATLNSEASKQKREAATAKALSKVSKKSVKQMADTKTAFSGKAAVQRMMAKTFELNEKVYAKSNPTLASMNQDARKQALARAEQYQNEANARKRR